MNPGCLPRMLMMPLLTYFLKLFVFISMMVKEVIYFFDFLGFIFFLRKPLFTVKL